MPKIQVLGVPHTYELTPPRNFPHVLVFLHGWLLSRKYWQPVVARLSSEYQCLTYDMRGFGDSQPLEASQLNTTAAIGREMPAATDESPYSLQAYARDLCELLNALQVPSAWLVGHSLGGSVAFWGAQQSSQLVQGIVGLNAGGGIYLKEEFERFRGAGQQLLHFRPHWLRYLPLVDVMFSRANVARPVALHWGRQRVVDFVSAQREAALGTLLDSTTEAEVHRLPQVVSQLKQPVYFIAGTDDKVMEPKYVKHLASFHPMFDCHGQNVIEIPHCGHMAMIEQPDAIAEQLRFILQQHA